MIRSVWLAFVFLAFIGALVLFKVGGATPSTQQTALAEPSLAGQAVADAAIEPEVAQDALAKADRLDDTPDKKPVQAIAIVPPQVVLVKDKPTRLVARHWRDSYAKVKKRKYHRHHATRTKKHRRAHR